ncbi:putative sugar transferase EpsL [Heyndrickxia sporothermodurans]|nr:putative sugar transferase EpsL [Heyndrickxia sporothermodurans]
MKRLFDLCISLSLLIIFFPLIVIIAILVKFKLGSPVIFKQLRPGLNEKPFYIYKFRTMTEKYGIDGELLPDHERLDSFGMFLRKFSLDELPQLINVIKGDLSIVGPRPLLMEYLPLYTLEQSKRHLVKPGITGWSQVNGRNLISWEKKFELDVWYVENQSFLLDLRILLLTIIKVFKTEGIQHNHQLTMPEFKGSSESDKQRKTKFI